MPQWDRRCEFCAEDVQRDVGDNDSDTVGVWGAGKRVRLSACPARDVLVFAGCSVRDVPLGVLCGIAQLGMFSRVVRYCLQGAAESGESEIDNCFSLFFVSQPHFILSGL